MNAIAALCQSFLNGDILTIKTAFKEVGVTNLGREVGRSIERKFGVRVSKLRKEGKSRYKVHVSYFEYRLNRDDPENASGIEAMITYVEANGGFVLPERRPVGRPKSKIEVTTTQKSQTPLF